MWAALVVLHVAVGIALILIVLLQTGKGAEMGAAFGGSSQTLFGSAGPGTFLGKLTTAAAVIFMCTSLALAYLSSGQRGGSVMRGAGRQVEQPAGQLPALPMPGEAGPVADQPSEAPAQSAPVAPAPEPAPAQQ